MKHHLLSFFSAILFVFMFIGLSFHLKANNIQINNVQIVNKNSAEHWANIRFDLTFDNAWRINTGASNWCAAWVFIKFRYNNGSWQHATLSSQPSHHTMPLNVSGDPSTDGKGIFIYDARPDIGNFNFSATGVVVRWNYGTDGLPDNQGNIEIKAFAIEMVYIPQGPFYLGSGGTENNSFYTFPKTNPTNPFLVNSENFHIGNTNSYLYYDVTFPYGSNSGDRGDAPESYPKGYNSFYIMRYEISQQQYVDFLNTLSRQQQISRVLSDISGNDVANYYVLTGSTIVQNRNGIRCPSSGNGTSEPITFFCDLNQNMVGDNVDDGQTIACGYLSWNDGLAYLDWAGLRPFTEFEYEKACRGLVDPMTSLPLPVPNDYAWGTASSIMVLSPIISAGQSSEVVSNEGDGLANYDDSQVGIGPLRCGFSSKNNTNRLQSGSSFFGVANLSDNLSERCITVGSNAGRNFIRNFGNGILTITGNSDVTGWPGLAGQSGRGGNYIRQAFRMSVSDRSYGYENTDVRYPHWGWRGAR